MVFVIPYLVVLQGSIVILIKMIFTTVFFVLKSIQLTAQQLFFGIKNHNSSKSVQSLNGVKNGQK